MLNSSRKAPLRPYGINVLMGMYVLPDIKGTSGRIQIKEEPSLYLLVVPSADVYRASDTINRLIVLEISTVVPV